MTRPIHILQTLLILLASAWSGEAYACGPRQCTQGPDSVYTLSATCPTACTSACKCGCQAKRSKPVRMVTVSIPDTLVDDVRMLLNPGTEVVAGTAHADRMERTVFRGDTIPMVLKSRNLGRFDRGLLNWLFIPRGTWNLGVTASYGEVGTQDLEMFGVLDDINISANSFSVKPYITYFIKDNFSVGMRFGYNRSYAGIESFNINIDEGMEFNLSDISYRNQSYTAAAVATQYIGLTRRGRFSIFNQVDLSLTNGYSDFNRPFGDKMKYTRTQYTEGRLTFSPGVSVLMMENVSFNVSLGVFGFYLRHEKQTDNGAPLGTRLNSGANFRLNIFNINFGIGVHI